MLDTNERIQDDIIILTIYTQIELKNALDLRKIFDRYIEKGCLNVILDIKAVTFIDSTGISALIYAYKKITEKKGNLVIINNCESIKKIFKITKLDSILKISSNEEEAFKSFNKERENYGV